jgi:excinuclease ABC subunit C
MHSSTLESIPGIGPGKARLLLKTFGSLTRLRAASLDDIAAVKGFSHDSAATLKKKLDSSDEG